MSLLGPLLPLALLATVDLAAADPARLTAPRPAPLHDGPDPLAAWDRRRPPWRTGPAGHSAGLLRSVEVEDEALHFDGASRVVADDFMTSRPSPDGVGLGRHRAPRPGAKCWGVIQDSTSAGSAVVGHGGSVFTFGLASEGADDGTGG